MRGIYRENHILANYTTWKVGGAAERFYQPADLSDLVDFLQELPDSSLPITWLGYGSNVLIRDGGIKGTVICLHGVLNRIQQIDDFTIKAEAGVSLPQLVKYCISQGMADVAFLAGIPGSIGGAMAMNAGACGDEIWNHIIAAEYINRHGKIKTEKASKFAAQYRSVLGLDKNEWFVAGHFVFTRSTPEAAKAKVQEYFSRRKLTQPLTEATCGSVFRNPPGNFAGKLIEDCSLKGMRIGGARISEKHANFIVNDGSASAADIENLINHIVSKVYKQCGITLIPEVHIIGEKNVSI